MQRNNIFTFSCPNCGTTLRSNMVVCPYCGFENVAAAAREEQARLQNMNIMHQKEMQEIPEKMVKKHSKRVIIVVVIVAIVLAVGVLLAIRGTVNYKKTEVIKYDKKQEMLDKLEELYQKGDYEAVKDTYYDSDYYGASFGKYANTAEIFYLCKYGKETLTNSYESESLCNVEEVSNNLLNSFYALHRINQFRDEGFIYGEGEAVEKMEKELLDVMQGIWKMTDAEISEGSERYVDKHTDYSDLAKTIIDRKENNG